MTTAFERWRIRKSGVPLRPVTTSSGRGVFSLRLGVDALRSWRRISRGSGLVDISLIIRARLQVGFGAQRTSKNWYELSVSEDTVDFRSTAAFVDVLFQTVVVLPHTATERIDRDKLLHWHPLWLTNDGHPRRRSDVRRVRIG
jgi:hypothetical protein